LLLKTTAKVTRLLPEWIVVRGTPRTDDGSPLEAQLAADGL